MPAGDLRGGVGHASLVAMETEEPPRPARGGGFSHRHHSQGTLHQVSDCLYNKTLNQRCIAELRQITCLFFRTRSALLEALSNPTISKPCSPFSQFNLCCPDLFLSMS